jgi:hypothetical protein
MKIILNEEEYMERLGAILKRDFFPSLQDEFTEPEQLSISEFQSIFTTEDNASFEELLARENARKRTKFEKIYGGPALLVDNPSKRLLLQETKVDEWKIKGKKGDRTSGNLVSWNEKTEKSAKINLQNTRFQKDYDDETLTIFKTSEISGIFKIPQTPARELLAHSLTAPPLVIKKQNTIRTPKVSKYSMEDLKGLTPRRKTE